MRTIGLPRISTAEALAGSAGTLAGSAETDRWNPYSRFARAARQRELVVASLVRCPQRSAVQHRSGPL